MSFFIIITVAFLIGSAVSMYLTNKAGKNDHNDNGGRFYYLITGLFGVVYTFQNVMLHLSGKL